jgi:hypothetical protein
VAYRGKPYWEQEQPEEARTERVALAWFPKAGKLQVKSLWRDDDGQLRPGKVVTLDAEDLALHPEVAALLRRVVGD